MEFVVQAAVAVERFPNRVILLGVRSESLNLEYGWMEPGVVLKGENDRLRSVVSFIEKPGPAEARNAMARWADINARRFDGARPIQLTNGDYMYRGCRDNRCEQPGAKEPRKPSAP